MKTGRACAAVAVGVAAAVAVAAWPVAAGAQKPPRSRSILVKPDNQFGEVELEMRLEAVRRTGSTAAVGSGDAVQVGDAVVLCFRSSAAGFVTVWSHDAEGGVPVRIYPNEFAADTAGDRAVPVRARQEACIGDDDGFRLEVGRPLGEASVYLHYTRREDQQFDETAFPQIRATRSPDPRPYASSYLQYRVVDP